MHPLGEIVVATGNPHKVEEIRALFRGLGIPIRGLAELDTQTTEPEETGKTFEDNARIKAVEYARQTGRACLADDSGLEVDALGGAPGVISSHYATGGAETGLSRAQRDAANNARLLRDLRGIPAHQRTARFVCIMCLATPEGELLMSRGTFEGRIGVEGEVPRGESGFGYDPLFVLEDGRTSAELRPEEKNARSHRGVAAREMARLLNAG
jgi:XTP/dITP diphosphohydrolase